jgi:hypothetical protein
MYFCINLIFKYCIKILFTLITEWLFNLPSDTLHPQQVPYLLQPNSNPASMGPTIPELQDVSMEETLETLVLDQPLSYIGKGSFQGIAN